jgi:hypothetical protein
MKLVRWSLVQVAAVSAVDAVETVVVSAADAVETVVTAVEIVGNNAIQEALLRKGFFFLDP